jgi:hypothetical protein
MLWEKLKSTIDLVYPVAVTLELPPSAPVKPLERGHT